MGFVWCGGLGMDINIWIRLVGMMLGWVGGIVLEGLFKDLDVCVSGTVLGGGRDDGVEGGVGFIWGAGKKSGHFWGWVGFFDALFFTQVHITAKHQPNPL